MSELPLSLQPTPPDPIVAERDKLKAEVERLRQGLEGWKVDCKRYWDDKIAAELQVDVLRGVLSDAVRGSCPICQVGGNSDLQNHHQDCEAGKLVVESRNHESDKR